MGDVTGVEAGTVRNEWIRENVREVRVTGEDHDANPAERHLPAIETVNR